MHSTVSGAAIVGLVCTALVGCAGGGALSSTASADLQQALAADCPILAAIQASDLSLDKYQRSAIATLALACPPNRPPTSALLAVADIVAAYTTLEPLLHR